MKKLTVLFGSSLFFFIVMCMYLMLDQFSGQIDHDSFLRETQKAADSVHEISKEVDKLKENLEFSNRAIDTMNDKVDDILALRKQNSRDDKIKFVPDIHAEESNEENAGIEMCKFTNASSGLKQDVKMIDVFNTIPFDNVDGGVWKQGWDIKYNEDDFQRKKLLVFVMPHSHNDPGWLKTVKEYFNQQTVKILNNVIESLAKDEKRKFIWAEISYFAMWWDQAEPRKKQMALEQVKNGQLEIVTGGWVMNDEANPHYFNIVDQLVEGHQWLENHLGVKPRHGWSIDPFGYSPTQAYLLKRMGFKAMLIQRVHYNIKKYFAKQKYLEFMWRQNWDHEDSTEIFTHMMPFYSYDVPHTCGPDPKVCCQFDFRRLTGGGVFCPWHVPPKEINDDNVNERAKTLLDQYKKKAQLYRSNIVLAPLGDDFRYDLEFETRAQYSNYEAIMKYVNSHPELNAEIKFGTLSDYFEAVANREGVLHGDKPKGFPSLGGDFFTYADRDDHYWSGYFTSRSFYKHMDRELAAHLRAAEIVFSLALAHSRHHGNFPVESLYPKLLSSRKELAVFQHHDGITGTSKDHVVIDYGQRMLQSIEASIKVMEASSHFLLTSNKDEYKLPDEKNNVIKFIESRASHDTLAVKKTIIISDKPKSLVFYNSLAQKRIQTVYAHISERFVKVLDGDGKVIPHQVSLIWKQDLLSTFNKYELSFVATMPPLGLIRYQVHRATGDADGSLATVEIYNIHLPEFSDQSFKLKTGTDSQIVIHNQFLTAKFNGEDGLLTDLKLMEKEHKVQIRFMKYGTVGKMDRSGAYLFLPSGQAMSIDVTNPPVTVTKGKIYTEIVSKLSYVTHRVKIHHSSNEEARALDINNVLDIRSTSNFELVMRVESDIKNTDREFFTDLNGFQMQRRLTLDKLPLQANFYPAPSMIYIQDRSSRLSIQTQQANGVASLNQGFMEVVLDRRLMQDDNRGLGQGVKDNKITPSNFRLVLEKFQDDVLPDPRPPPVSYPSIESITLSHQLQYPVYGFSIESEDTTSLLPSLSGLKKPLPCDLHLVNLKSLQNNIKEEPNDVAALFLHRTGYDCRFKCRCSERRLTFQDIFEPLSVNDVKAMSLSLMYEQKTLNANDRINVLPMEINAYKIELK